MIKYKNLKNINWRSNKIVKIKKSKTNKKLVKE